MKYTYLLIDFFSIIVPFAFSFHPKLKFYKAWPAIFPALIVTALVFIAGDAWFTHLKVWGFNPAYLTGIFIGNLPMEEVLFFLCIPYACVFTYHCINLAIKKSMSIVVEQFITAVLIGGSIVLAILFYKLSYTTFTFAFLASLVIVARFIVKVTWLPGFYISYLVLLIPFMIVNGLLTGTGLNAPVVWYNQAQNLNIRIMTIPVEDVFYGMDLVLLNILLYSMIFKKISKSINMDNTDFLRLNPNKVKSEYNSY